MKYIFRRFALLAILGFLFLPVGSHACGCGMAFQINPNDQTWKYASGNTDAFINYDKQQEQLVFSRTLSAEQDTDKILLVPVPAQPAGVKVDVLTELPSLSGDDIMVKTALGIRGLNNLTLFTQIVPYTVWNFITQPLGLTQSTNAPTGSFSLGAPDSSKSSDVTVYTHLEKAGLVNEVLTAKTAVALQTYFTEKHLTFDPKSIPALTNYIGQDYSFVASWRSAQNNLEPPQEIIDDMSNSSRKPQESSTTVGLSLTFPTTKVFYPLIPTSTLGHQPITETIHLIGQYKIESKVLPQFERETTPQNRFAIHDSSDSGTIQTNYYLADQKSTDFGDQTVTKTNLMYTNITLSGESQQFKEDLWLSPRVAPSVTLASLILTNPIADIALVIVWFLFIFMLAGVLAGMIAFGRADEAALSAYARFGLWNFLTIIAVTIALNWFKLPGDESQPPGWRKFIFWLCLTLFITALSIGLSLAIIQLGGYDIQTFLRGY